MGSIKVYLTFLEDIVVFLVIIGVDVVVVVIHIT